MAVNPVGGSGDANRDGACTPKWLADLIGAVNLDPCSNERSHIRAYKRCTQPTGNGLLENPGEFYDGGPTTGFADQHWLVFINPPYSRGQVMKWVLHYRHTRFIYLLRWDPSTKWFAELIPHCTHVWFPRRRISFEPPPGVEFSSNPFPHALYLRGPSDALLNRLSPHGFLFDFEWGACFDAPNADEDDSGDGDSGDGESPEPAKAAGGGGGGAGPAVCSCVDCWYGGQCVLRSPQAYSKFNEVNWSKEFYGKFPWK